MKQTTQRKLQSSYCVIVILCSVRSLVLPDTGRGVLSVSRYVLSSGVLLFLTPVVVFSALVVTFSA